jgi:soluble lytic murein transglycosylase-like protein
LAFPVAFGPTFEISCEESVETPDAPVIEEPVPEKPTTKYYDVPLSEDLQDHIFRLCEKNNIDPALVIAMIKRESSYNANTIGDNGNSFGLMQIQPRWHQGRMDRLGCSNLLDPYQNVTVGIDFLAELFAKGKPVEWVLMAYNGGMAYANKNWNAGVTSSYANKVLETRNNLKLVE